MDLKVKEEQRELDFKENLRKAKGQLNENKEIEGKNWRDLKRIKALPA